MARTENLHTTKMLAHALGMNYAWGLEFVELTNGNYDETKATEGKSNKFGLHGNAILTKCPMKNPKLIRDGNIGDYFSSGSTQKNAFGAEKRLGGRMSMFVDIITKLNKQVTLGATHTLEPKMQGEVKTYLSDTLIKGNVVIAGDQFWEYCNNVGLVHVDSKAIASSPASCDSLGVGRGDILCSSMAIKIPFHGDYPCTHNGPRITMSDHSFQSVTLTVK